MNNFKQTISSVFYSAPVLSMIARALRITGFRNAVLSSNRPRVAMFAITQKCQCSCKHCGVAFQKSERKELSLNEIKNTINQLPSLGIKVLYLFGGEPLLRKELSAIILHAKSRSLEVQMDTNGYLLSYDRVRMIKKSGIDLIRVSLDSASASKHDANRNCTGLYSRVIAGVKSCIAEKVNCHLSTCVTREMLASGELDSIIKIASELGVKLRLLKPVLTGNLLEAKEQLFTEKETEQLRSYLSSSVYLEAEYINSPGVPFICNAKLRKIIFISAEGDVQPCCYLPIRFGNIRDTQLSHIIEAMYSSSIFDSNIFQCPMNTDAFRERYFLSPEPALITSR